MSRPLCFASAGLTSPEDTKTTAARALLQLSLRQAIPIGLAYQGVEAIGQFHAQASYAKSVTNVFRCKLQALRKLHRRFARLARASNFAFAFAFALAVACAFAFGFAWGRCSCGGMASKKACAATASQTEPMRLNHQLRIRESCFPRQSWNLEAPSPKQVPRQNVFSYRLISP